MALTRWELKGCVPPSGEFDCEAEMIRSPQGDYVEFSDHEDVVGTLQEKIDRLQRAVNKAYENLQGEASLWPHL